MCGTVKRGLIEKRFYLCRGLQVAYTCMSLFTYPKRPEKPFIVFRFALCGKKPFQYIIIYIFRNYVHVILVT